MIDRKQYDIEMDNVRLEQIKNISEFLSDYIEMNAKMRDCPVSLTLDEETAERIKQTPIPKKGRNPKEVGDEIVKDILSHTMNIQHPRFYSFVTSAVSPYSLAGSVLCDIYNPNVAGWNLAPAPAMIEEKCIKFMASRIGYDTEKCGAINFRYEPEGYPEDKLDELGMQISKRILEDGYAHIITTELKGKKALRLCLINGNTTTEDVQNTIEYLNKIANEIYPADSVKVSPG